MKKPPSTVQSKDLQIKNHWLQGAIRKASENFDARPDADDISLIVIHCISLPPGEFNTPHIDQLFNNQLQAQDHPYFKGISQLRVSAHILIKRTGEICQYVAFNQRAWHAGQSEYEGRKQCNDFSIGIELEGTETVPYTEQQYLKLALLINTLIAHYPALTPERITGHSNIAPDRKTDPGKSFSWQKLDQLLRTKQ